MVVQKKINISAELGRAVNRTITRILESSDGILDFVQEIIEDILDSKSNVSDDIRRDVKTLVNFLRLISPMKGNMSVLGSLAKTNPLVTINQVETNSRIKAFTEITMTFSAVANNMREEIALGGGNIASPFVVNGSIKIEGCVSDITRDVNALKELLEVG